MILALDANIVIYLVERVLPWYPRVVARLTAATAAGDVLAVSDAAVLECLVGPLRAGNAVLESYYRAFFAGPGLRRLATTAAVWERAARVRAAFNLQPLDSLHLAAAVEHGCGAFLTQDTQLARFPGIPVEILP